jgi:hypothetical protein
MLSLMCSLCVIAAM